MPKGLILVNSILVGIGLICSALLYSKLEIIPLVLALVIAVFFNLVTGATNSPDNINSKVRMWLFGEKDRVDISKIAKELYKLQTRR